MNNKEIVLICKKEAKEIIIGSLHDEGPGSIQIADCVIIIIQPGPNGEQSLVAVDYPVGLLPEFVKKDIIDDNIYTFDKDAVYVYNDNELTDKIKGWYTQVMQKKKSNIEIIAAGGMPNGAPSKIIH